MSRYANSTQVGSSESRNEIERTLSRYGADSFMYGWQKEQAVVAFQMEGRHVKFVLPMPDKRSDEFIKTPTGRDRSESQTVLAFEQATRQRWRALALVIKAKLEAVESKITCFEDEFMAHIVLPSGETVSQWMRPQIETAYASGTMPKLLPMLAGEQQVKK